MKIVYHHSAKWISNSPSITFITFTAIGFAKAGYEIHLVVWDNSDESTENILKNTFNQKYIPENLHIQRIKAKNKRDFYKNSFSKINKLDVDLVISRALTFLPSLIKLKSKKVKVYFEMHDLFVELIKRKDIIRRKKAKHYLTEKLFFSRLDGIICLQKAQEKIIKKHFDQKTIIAPTGLEIQDIHIDLNKRENWAYIGSFDEHKGVFDFLRSIKNYPNIPVKLIGGKSQNEIDSIKEIVNGICPNNEVVFTGWLSKSELKKELEDVKFGIIPLKDTYFNRYLTSPLKLFDYYSNQIPPIISDLDSIRDLVIDGESGFLSSWSDYSIEKILSIRDEDYLKLCNNIKVLSQDLTWEKRAKKIMESIL